MDLNAPRGNRRFGGRRWNVVWPATYTVEGQTVACTILDLSRTGARIEGAGLRPFDAVLTLRCEHFGALDARVMWVRGGKAGLRFEHPQAEVVELLQKVVPGIGRREAAPAAQPQRARFGRRGSIAA
mgnify:CR=1 FL=1